MHNRYYFYICINLTIILMLMVDNQAIPSSETYRTDNSHYLSGICSNVSVVTIHTRMPISYDRIPLFRGAIINLIGQSEELLHDHRGNGFRYSYPLIQYKVIEGNAAIIAINEGIRVAKSILPLMNSTIRLGQRHNNLTLDDVKYSTTIVTASDAFHSYTIHRWLPLNQENYTVYLYLEDATQRIEMLERLLVANIISFAKGVGVFIDTAVTLTIIDIKHVRQLKYKNIQMLGFDLLFKANVTLPSNIGLGKGVSLGFGTITE